jgi:protein-disulfide isomerase
MIRIVSFLFAVTFSAAAFAQQFGAAQYRLKMDDGDLVTNFDLGKELASELAQLPGVVPVGNLRGDVTVMQFYDLNCPFCREAAADVDALVRADKNLKLVFVPYAVLSLQSVKGAMVELAAAKLLSPEKYLEFHRRIYANRGTIDEVKVMQAAKDVGLEQEAVAKIANNPETLQILRENADFGGAAKMVATPAYVVNNVAILGHPGLKPLQQVVAAVRRCGKIVCS